MLNEELEYLEYTLKTKKLFRLVNKKDLLTLTGTRRVLEIIARKIYWDHNGDFNGAKRAVYDWFGDFFRGYYVKEYLGDYLKKDNNRKMLNSSLESKENNLNYLIFRESVFNPVFKQGGVGAISLNNSLNAYSSFDVVSRAIEDGPLRINYLVCDDRSIFNKIISLENNEAVRGKRRDYVLKEIATYLLNKRVDNQDYVFYTRADLKNWCLNSSGNGRYEPKTYRYLSDGIDEPFVYVKQLVKKTNNRSAYMVNPNISKHFKIVGGDELESVVKKGDVDCIFVDVASGDLMLRGVEVYDGQQRREFGAIIEEIGKINEESINFLTLE